MALIYRNPSKKLWGPVPATQRQAAWHTREIPHAHEIMRLGWQTAGGPTREYKRGAWCPLLIVSLLCSLFGQSRPLFTAHHSFSKRTHILWTKNIALARCVAWAIERASGISPRGEPWVTLENQRREIIERQIEGANYENDAKVI